MIPSRFFSVWLVPIGSYLSQVLLVLPNPNFSLKRFRCFSLRFLGSQRLARLLMLDVGWNFGSDSGPSMQNPFHHPGRRREEISFFWGGGGAKKSPSCSGGFKLQTQLWTFYCSWMSELFFFWPFILKLPHSIIQSATLAPWDVSTTLDGSTYLWTTNVLLDLRKTIFEWWKTLQAVICDQ